MARTQTQQTKAPPEQDDPRRARKLAQGLRRLGVVGPDRVGDLGDHRVRDPQRRRAQVRAEARAVLGRGGDRDRGARAHVDLDAARAVGRVPLVDPGELDRVVRALGEEGRRRAVVAPGANAEVRADGAVEDGEGHVPGRCKRDARRPAPRFAQCFEDLRAGFFGGVSGLAARARTSTSRR